MSFQEAGELSRSKNQFILDSAHFFPLDTMVEDAEVLLREVERIEGAAEVERALGGVDRGASLLPAPAIDVLASPLDRVVVVAPPQGAALMETLTGVVMVATAPEDAWAKPGVLATTQIEGRMGAKTAAPGLTIPQGVLELRSEDTVKKGTAVCSIDPPRKRVWLSEAAGGPKARRRKGNPSPGLQRLEGWLLMSREIKSGTDAVLLPQVAVAEESPTGGGIGRKVVNPGICGADVGPEEGWASTVSEAASRARTVQTPLEVARVVEQLVERERRSIAPRVVVSDQAEHVDAEQRCERVDMGTEVVPVARSEVAAANSLRAVDQAVSTAKRKQMGIGDWITRKIVGPRMKLLRVETESAGELGVKRRCVDDDAEMPGKRMRESGRWEPAADAEPPD